MVPITVLVVGLFLGMRHATDADHVIAVSTIVTRERSLHGAIRIGLLWGLGHSLTVLMAGGAIVLLGLVIPRRLGLGLEFSVAVMLIILGGMNLKGVVRWWKSPQGTLARTKTHAHGDYVHTHPHDPASGRHGHSEEETPVARLDHRLGRRHLYQWLRPLIIGIIHGLAGSAALALLLLPAIRGPFEATAYLLFFSLGTIAGMMLITVAMAGPILVATRRFGLTHDWLPAVSGLASVCFGVIYGCQVLLAL